MTNIVCSTVQQYRVSIYLNGKTSISAVNCISYVHIDSPIECNYGQIPQKDFPNGVSYDFSIN